MIDMFLVVYHKQAKEMFYENLETWFLYIVCNCVRMHMCVCIYVCLRLRVYVYNKS